MWANVNTFYQTEIASHEVYFSTTLYADSIHKYTATAYNAIHPHTLSTLHHTTFASMRLHVLPYNRIQSTRIECVFRPFPAIRSDFVTICYHTALPRKPLSGLNFQRPRLSGNASNALHMYLCVRVCVCVRAYVLLLLFCYLIYIYKIGRKPSNINGHSHVTINDNQNAKPLIFNGNKNRKHGHKR